MEISPAGVRALIRKGVLKAEKFGRDYLIKEIDLYNCILDRPKPGRPRKTDQKHRR
jgi:hypothetical protein